MTKPPRRLMSVPVQINQYVGGKPSIREERPFLFIFVFLGRFRKYNRCSNNKKSLRRDSFLPSTKERRFDCVPTNTQRLSASSLNANIYTSNAHSPERITGSGSPSSWMPSISICGEPIIKSTWVMLVLPPAALNSSSVNSSPPV